MIKIDIEVNDAEACGMTEQRLGEFLCKVIDAYLVTIKRPGFNLRNTPDLFHQLNQDCLNLDGGWAQRRNVMQNAVKLAASALVIASASLPSGPDVTPNAS